MKRETDQARRITGHTVLLDNMGFGGLVHPYACTVRHTPLDCPVTQALVEGRVTGSKGKGRYHVAIDARGDAVLHLDPLDLGFQPEWEIVDLLNAFVDEVGTVRARAGVGAWVLAQQQQSRGAG